MSQLGQNPNLPHRNTNGRFTSISGHAAASSVAYCRVRNAPEPPPRPYCPKRPRKKRRQLPR
jgi:hypothetical protein